MPMPADRHPPTPLDRKPKQQCGCKWCRDERATGKTDLLLPAEVWCSVCGHGYSRTPGAASTMGCTKCGAVGHWTDVFPHATKELANV